MNMRSRDDQATIWTTWFRISAGQWWDILSSSLCPARLWIPPNLLSNGYRGLFARG